MISPMFSVVIPTKDRAHLLQKVMTSLMLQTFRDFEVIVSDNSEKKNTFNVNDYRNAKFRLRYYKTEKVLPMHDNWEWALSKATGKYVMLLEDKILLHKKCLEILYKFTQSDRYEIITSSIDNYLFTNELSGLEGTYLPRNIISRPKEFDPQKLKKKWIKSLLLITAPSKEYFQGKIMFGVYSKSLLNRIKSKYKDVFHPYSPDYTSLILGLCEANKCIDVGEPLMLGLDSKLSNGYKTTQSLDVLRKFMKQVDPNCLLDDSWPIPSLYASLHNLIESDILRMNTLAGCSNKDFNCNRLIYVSYYYLEHYFKGTEQFTMIKEYFDKVPFYFKLREDLKYKINKYFAEKYLRAFPFLKVAALFLKNKGFNRLTKYIFYFDGSIFLNQSYSCDSIEEALEICEKHYSKIKRDYVKK